MNVKRFILWSFFILTLVSSLVLTSCDLHDDDSDSNSGATTITGVVQASYLKGVKVCVEDRCVTTDDKGQFTLKNVEIPTTIVFKIGNKILGNKVVNEDNANNILITPMALANDNKTLANYIGALLHSIGGCAISADKCDLSTVKELKVGNDNSTSEDKDIVEIVKETIAKSDNVSYEAFMEGKDGDIIIHKSTIDKNSAQFYGQATENDDNDSTVNDNSTDDNSNIDDDNSTNIDDDNSTNNDGTVNLDNASFLGVSDDYKTLLVSKYNKKNGSLYIRSLIQDNWAELHLKSIYKNVVFQDNNGNIYFISPNIMIYPYEDAVNGEDHASILFRNYGNSVTYENMQEGDYSILNIGITGLKAGTAKITKTNGLKGQWTFNSTDGTSDKGTWELSSDLRRVIATHENGSQDNSSIFLKPSYSKNDRSGFLVLPDVDTSDINSVYSYNITFGLLKKKLTADEIIGTYYSYRAKKPEDYSSDELDIECYGKTTISNQNGKLKFNYQDGWCSDGAKLDTISGDIELNPKLGNTELTGFAFVKIGQEGYNILTINSGDIIFYGSGTDNVADASTFLIGTPQALK